MEGGATSLSSGVSFSYGVVSTPPPNTQGTIGQAPLCTDDTGTTSPTPPASCSTRAACRSTRSELRADRQRRLYVTDGTAVFGVTVAATGMVRMWRTLPAATPYMGAH